MPNPDRPDFDAIIDAEWGEFVHDHVVGTFRGRVVVDPDASGYATITKASLGLATVTDAIATIFSQPDFPELTINFVAVCQAVPAGVVVRLAKLNAPGPAGGEWYFMGLGDLPVTINLIAWGTPTP